MRKELQLAELEGFIREGGKVNRHIRRKLAKLQRQVKPAVSVKRIQNAPALPVA
jgi:hypothetical protein